MIKFLKKIIEYIVCENSGLNKYKMKDQEIIGYCNSCESFNKIYDLDDPPERRGETGSCVYPFRFHEHNISTFPKSKISPMKYRDDHCLNYRAVHCDWRWC